MAITPTGLAGAASNTSGTSFTTASISPTSGATVYATYVARRAAGAEPTTPTVTGAGLTWTEVSSTVAYYDASGTTSKLFVFEGTGTPSASAVTFDHDATTHAAAGWGIVELDSDTGTVGVVSGQVETSGTASDSVTSRTLTFTSTPSGGVLTAASTNSNAAGPSPGEGYGTSLASGTSSAGGYNTTLEVFFDAAGADATVDWTWAGPNAGGCWAFEVEEVTAGATVDANLLSPVTVEQPAVATSSDVAANLLSPVTVGQPSVVGSVTVTANLLSPVTVEQPAVSAVGQVEANLLSPATVQQPTVTTSYDVTANLLSPATVEQPAVTVGAATAAANLLSPATVLQPAVQAGTLLHSVVGAVRSTTAVVNAKLENTTSAQLRVATNSGLTTDVSTSSSETPDANGYVSLSVSGLTADTDYHYGVEVDGGTSDAALRGTFATHPTVGAAANFTVCMSSCMNDATDAGLGNTLDEIRTQQDPLFFVHLGDFDYDDVNSSTLTDYLDAYEGQIDDANVATFLRSVPTEYRWSDHDFLGNNVQGEESGTTQANRLVRSAAARDVFPLADLGDATANGAIYRSFQVGRVLFVIADERYYAIDESDTDNSSKWKWGSDQRAWLESELAATSARLVVVCHDTVWHRGAQAGNDSWGGFTNERTLIDDVIEAAGIPTIHAGGDSHSLAVADTGLDYTTAQDGGLSRMATQNAALQQSGSTEGGPWTLTQRDPDLTNQIDAGDSQYGRFVFTDDGSTITVSWTGRVATSATTSSVNVPTDGAAATFSVATVDANLLSPAAVLQPAVTATADVAANLLSPATVEEPAVSVGAATQNIAANLLSPAAVPQPSVTPGTVTITLHGFDPEEFAGGFEAGVLQAEVLEPAVTSGSTVAANLLAPATVTQSAVTSTYDVTADLLAPVAVAPPAVSVGAATVAAGVLSPVAVEEPTVEAAGVVVAALLSPAAVEQPAVLATQQITVAALTPVAVPQPAVAAAYTVTAALLTAAGFPLATVTTGAVTVTATLLSPVSVLTAEITDSSRGTVGSGVASYGTTVGSGVASYGTTVGSGDG